MNTTDRRSEERNPFQTNDTMSAPRPRSDMAYRQVQRPQQVQPRQEIVKEALAVEQTQTKAPESAQAQKTVAPLQKKGENCRYYFSSKTSREVGYRASASDA